MKEKWIMTNKRESFLKLSNSIEENSLLLRLLANRSIDDVELAKKFLYGTIKDLYDGYLIKDMDKGVEIIKSAVLENRKIVIYGDYDCDGVISTTILYNALKEVGANFGYHIPHREDEGYGLNSERIKKLREEGYEVILTCDNGISGFEQINLAKELGMDVIVTDHHDIPLIENEEGEFVLTIPKADAVINPKRSDCKYPFKLLCGAGVVLKLSQCLFKEFNIDESKLYNLLQYAAIATVCDVVDLIDENRIIVQKGLEILSKTENIGLKELYKVTGLENKKIEEYHLGFVIGPCVNSTGRLETAALSVELLITEDIERAKELASTLHKLNVERQDLTQEGAKRIIEKLEREKSKDKVLVVYDEEIHESIAGIVAGRIKEKFHKPAIVITRGKEMPKGSARSIENYNINEELTKCRELLEKFGGHPMAAGLSLREENIEPLRRKLNSICELTEEDILPIVRIDSELKVNYLNEDLINTINKLKPYGKANPSPLFAVRNLFAERIWLIGKEKNYLKLRFKFEHNGGILYIDGISFNNLDDLKEQIINEYNEEEFIKAVESSYLNKKLDIVYYPGINEFNGNRNIQLMIKHLRLSQ